MKDTMQELSRLFKNQAAVDLDVLEINENNVLEINENDRGSTNQMTISHKVHLVTSPIASNGSKDFNGTGAKSTEAPAWIRLEDRFLSFSLSLSLTHTHTHTHT